VDVPLPWERLLWSCRSLPVPRSRIVLTDFRLVRLDRDRFAEIAIQDVAEVRRSQTRLDKLFRTSTLVISHRDRRRAPLTLPHVRRGVQLAALIDLLADDPTASIDPAAPASTRTLPWPLELAPRHAIAWDLAASLPTSTSTARSTWSSQTAISTQRHAAAASGTRSRLSC